MATRDAFDEATARGNRRRESGPLAVSARYDRRAERVVVTLDNGLDVGFAPAGAEGLEQAKPADLSVIEISPSGLGLHFPRVDADIYLPALLEGLLGSQTWMASQLGAIGGRARSEAKTAASRANGKLGGRPRTRAVR